MRGGRIRTVVALTAVFALCATGVAVAGKKKHHKPPKKHHAAKKHHKSKPKTKPKTKTSGKNTIKVSGPTANVFHHYFNETVSGNATGNANFVISGEQLNPAGGCSSTYTAERAKSDWYQWPTGTGAVHGKFSMMAKFYARNHKKHGICSYLLNSGTDQTFAHASRFWNNS
jgi:hypothetical protein